MGRPSRLFITLAAAIALAAPAAAQFSDSYNFLKAVRERDGSKATELLDKPGRAALSARDPSTGETALHIIVRAHDQTWLGFLLNRGAQIEAKDSRGNTPLGVAAQTGDADAARILLVVGANPNTANDSGETPLIFAVQRRDTAMARQLVTAGADPTRRDTIAGKSAADYAAEDARGTALVKILADAKPRKPAANIAGPVR